ncbi:serine hydrolase, partial [Sphingopyxis sp.]|uniref:serine hydrolase n=1 Tax=Sphingopyxis sp. TaxID=1908224 RepID=UPI002ED88B52
KMRSSYWTVPAAEVGRFATNYMIMGDKHSPLDPAATSPFLNPPSFPYGGAGLVMSARDYDRFLHMLQSYGQLDGVRVMKTATAKLAMSDLLPEGVEFTGTEGPTGAKLGFGAGGFVVKASADPMIAGAYGWGGAAGTVAWVNPVSKVRGAIMVNYFPGEKWPIRDETLKALTSDMTRYGLKR